MQLLLIAIRFPTKVMFLGFGLLTFCLAVIRPSTQLCLLFVLLPFLKNGISVPSIRLAGIFVLGFLIPAAAYSYHNYVRFETFSIARQGSGALQGDSGSFSGHERGRG